MRHNKKELVTIKELKERLENAIVLENKKINNNPQGTAKRNNRSQYNNINRYEFGLRIANGIKETLKVNVKTTANGAVNIGELGEIYIKSKLESNKRVLRTSTQNMKDLNRYHKSEVKVVTKTTKSNSWDSSRGAIIIMQGDNDVKEGVYWLTRDEIAVNFRNNDRLDHKGVKEIINDYEIKRIRVGA